MKLNNSHVKKQNKIAVFRYLMDHLGASKPEISAKLSLSLPTVGALISELIDAGLVEEMGMQSSNGGRRAVALKANTDARKSVGLDITKNHVGMVVVDLAGEVLAWERYCKPFQESEIYWEEVKGLLAEFLERHQVNYDALEGTGISMPGIMNLSHDTLITSHILQLKKPVRVEQPLIEGIPLRLFNDATAVCMAELYTGCSPKDFTLITLSNTVGGARVSDGKVRKGHSNRNGEIGHICLIPKGRRCYCGKEGHFDAYCSALILAEKSEGKSVEKFFEELENGSEKCREVFDEYLDYLALMIYNLHMENDDPVVLGGYVGSYLKDYLPEIQKRLDELDIFEEMAYLYLCQYNVEAAAVGAARYFTEKFIEEL